MTAEEIAELRALTHRCKGALPPCECDLPALLGAMDLEDAPLPMLQRLLDEREALLEALTDAVEAIAGEWGESSAADLRAAIAKARSP